MLTLTGQIGDAAPLRSPRLGTRVAALVSIIVIERHVIEHTLNEPFKTLLAQECQPLTNCGGDGI